MRFLRKAEAILPFVFWLLVIFAFDEPAFAAMTIAAAVIHELGHVAAGATRGEARLFPNAVATGLRIPPRGTLSYKDEMILTLGGPLAGLIAALLSALLFFIFPHFGHFRTFSAVNLMTSLGNLLPIRGYDGYRLIECSILLFSPKPEALLRAAELVSTLATTLLTFLSLYLILKLGEGYWIFCVFFSSLLARLVKFHESGKFRE